MKTSNAAQRPLRKHAPNAPRIQSQEANRKKSRNPKKGDVCRIPIITLLKSEQSKTGAHSSESTSVHKTSKIEKLKKKIQELENEAITNCGMKFTKVYEGAQIKSEEAEERVSEDEEAQQVSEMNNMNYE